VSIWRNPVIDRLNMLHRLVRGRAELTLLKKPPTRWTHMILRQENQNDNRKMFMPGESRSQEKSEANGPKDQAKCQLQELFKTRIW